MNRDQADHQIFQYRPVQATVSADAFVGVEPFFPAGISLSWTNGRCTIEGSYGIDTFPEHRFVLLVNGNLRTFHRWADLPDEFDNVIEFAPDTTHDRTFIYTFLLDGVAVTHSHWVHHDMAPWEDRLRELVARENNGGWNASSHAQRRRRRLSLLGHGPT